MSGTTHITVTGGFLDVSAAGTADTVNDFIQIGGGVLTNDGGGMTTAKRC